MRPPRIALLNAAHDDPNNVRNFRREIDGALAEFHVVEGELPPSYDFDGVVVTGSRASVYWDEAWIEPTRQWVQSAIDHGIPHLGVCWGHQLLATTLGGHVAGMGEYEIGYRMISKRGESDLLAGIDDEFMAFTTHSDEVVEPPAGAAILAANDYSIHAFRKGNVYGVQFHPEYDRQTAHEVTMGKEDELPKTKLDAVLAGITRANEGRAQQAKRVFDNFIEITRDVSARGRQAAMAADD